MADTYKVLGQANPVSETATVLYTVPASKQAVISTISVCNMATSDTNFRVIIQKAADQSSILAKQYFAYDTKLFKNDTTSITVGITLAAGDRVQVYTESDNNVTFQAFGSEMSTV
jgi:hypothetical protein